MKKNEDNMTINFHTCLILVKDIEDVVKDATSMWKNVYHLHKSSENLVEINDYDDSDKDEDNEEDNTPCVTIDVEDYQELMKNDEEGKEDEVEEEAKKEEEEEEEESDLVRIAIEVIASLPHSSPKTTTSSSMEIA